MQARILLVLALVLGALVLWLLAGNRSSADVQAGRAPSRTQTRAEPAALLAPSLPEASAPDGVAASTRQEPVRGVESDAKERVADEPVRVRVQLTLASGAPGAFDGWKVEAQSWIADTGATFPHEARADAEGLAQFVFPGFVHIDWVRCIPPPASGLALSVSEPHIDLDPGEIHEETLELAPGGSFRGRVVDDRGAPVPGARVHGFYETSPSSFDDWEPGVIVLTTGADGRYRMPFLPPGEWMVAVEPDAWLQLEPQMNDGVEGRSTFQLEEGTDLDGGDLVVVPLHRAVFSVVDARGAPMGAAEFEFRPLELRAGGLELERDERSDPVERFLAGESASAAPRRSWSYGSIGGETDAEGRMALLGVEGTWALDIRPFLVQQGAFGSLHLEIDLPCADRTVRLPAPFERFVGRVVDADGPLENVRAILQHDRIRIDERSGEDGRFELDGVPPGGDNWLGFESRAHVPAAWPMPAPSAEPPTFVLRRGGRVALRLVDGAGEPVRHRSLKILASFPDAPLSPEELAWNRIFRRESSSTSNSRGECTFWGCPPGRVEVGLLLPQPTGPVDGLGNPSMEMGVFLRWTLPVQDETQELRIDLSTYDAPKPPPQALHEGLVTDAATGAPLAGASVLLRSRNAARQCMTDAGGRFRLVGLPGACTILVAHEGYLRTEVEETVYDSRPYVHRFALEPGGRTLLVRFLDRDGQPLPDLQAYGYGEDGKPLLSLGRGGGFGTPWYGWPVPSGQFLELTAVPPGPLRFSLSLGGVTLGECSVDVGAGAAPQEATLRLDRSLAELRAAVAEAVRADEDGED